MLRRSTRVIGGRRFVSAIWEYLYSGIRFQVETVLYPTKGRLISVSYTARVEDFDSTRPERDALFTQGVGFDESVGHPLASGVRAR